MERMRIVRRVVAAAAFAASAVALVVAPRPAAAVVKPAMTIRVGQVITLKAPSPTAPGEGYLFGGLQPSDCEISMSELGSSEFCDSYPITLDVPRDVIKQGNLQLNATLTWDNKAGVYVPNCPNIGNCGTNQMGMEVWGEIPPQKVGTRGLVLVGDCEIPEGQFPEGPARDTYTENVCPYPDPTDEPFAGTRGFFQEETADSPVTLAVTSAGICGERLVEDPEVVVPKDNVCPHMFVDVGNYVGQNPYTLSIELVDYSGSIPKDLSADDDVPVDQSGDASAPPTADAPSSSTSFTAIGSEISAPALDGALAGAGAPRVDLPGLGSSAGFDGIAGAPFGSADLAKQIVNRGPKQLGAAPPANGLLLAVWLVLLPLGGILSFLFFLWRRRREEDAGPAAA
jgi:hypothetical protein